MAAGGKRNGKLKSPGRASMTRCLSDQTAAMPARPPRVDDASASASPAPDSTAAAPAAESAIAGTKKNTKGHQCALALRSSSAAPARWLRLNEALSAGWRRSHAIAACAVSAAAVTRPSRNSGASAPAGAVRTARLGRSWP